MDTIYAYNLPSTSWLLLRILNARERTMFNKALSPSMFMLPLNLFRTFAPIICVL